MARLSGIRMARAICQVVAPKVPRDVHEDDAITAVPPLQETFTEQVGHTDAEPGGYHKAATSCLADPAFSPPRAKNTGEVKRAD